MPTGTAVLVFNLQHPETTFDAARSVPGVTVLTEWSLVTCPPHDGTTRLGLKASSFQGPDGFAVELDQLQGALR